MSFSKIKRRDFLKIMGWGGVGATLAGCDLPSTVTLEEGKEEVVSYLVPEEYVIPGVGVWYASTCQQCPSGCGIHGRVREGRVLKLEGNPESSINKGRLCQMGQAGLQAHYNPDRISKPQIRRGDSLVDATWEEVYGLIAEKTANISGGKFAWVTGSISGHQSVLLQAYLNSIGSGNHYAHETIHNAIWSKVSQDMLGDSNPRLRLDKAQSVLSFGADFLGTWSSPLHFSTEYAKFRTSPRGVLIQVEPSMSLTGANADLWVAAKPGTEGALALGIANQLVSKHGLSMAELPGSVQALIRGYSMEESVNITGIDAEQIAKIAQTLKQRAPSLVIAGASAEGHEHGYQNVAAAMVLNIILGNVGKTIESNGDFAYASMAPIKGNSQSLVSFSQAAADKRFDVVFFSGTNPLYTAPQALGLKESLANIPFKVAFSHFNDETTAMADVVLPLASGPEDWGTHVAPYQAGRGEISIQQPLMEPLSAETQGFGDILLTLLKKRKESSYEAFSDYYAFLRNAFSNIPAEHKNGASDEEFWTTVLSKGLVDVGVMATSLSAKAVDFDMPKQLGNSSALVLAPAARLGFWDGRHANLPWLQEAPDQISKVVWDSWAELHPSTAKKLDVKEGDMVKIASAQGEINVKVYVYKGVHPDVIAVPLGQGHDAGFSRYAKERGVNALAILDPKVDKMTGELAIYSTNVKVTKAAKSDDILVRFGGSETQIGRKLVATIPADVYERTEGGNNVA